MINVIKNKNNEIIGIAISDVNVLDVEEFYKETGRISKTDNVSRISENSKEYITYIEKCQEKLKGNYYVNNSI